MPVPEDYLHKENIEREIKKRYETVGGRIRLLMSPHVTTEELRQKLLHATARIDFNHLLSAHDIDETGAAPSLYYSIISDEKSGFMEKWLDFSCPLAQQSAITEYQERHKGDAFKLFRVARLSTVASEFAGRVFETNIHNMIEEAKPLKFKAKYLPGRDQSTTDFELEFRFGDAKDPIDIADLVQITCQTGGLVKVSLLLPRNYEINDGKNGTTHFWANLKPQHLFCPDYDAMHSPFLVRQDTISSEHPFTNARVESLMSPLRQKLAAFDSYQTIKKQLGILPGFPWFVYFVPDDVYDNFKFQPPKSASGKQRIVRTKIPQIVVKVELKGASR